MNKKNFVLVGAATFFLLLTIVSCSKEKDKPECDGSSPTYDAQIKAIVDGSCLGSGCHGAGSGNGDFTTYSKLNPFLQNGSFEREVLIDQTMPRGSGTLTASELSKLQCWVEDAHPES